jgi:hypothetical protein
MTQRTVLIDSSCLQAIQHLLRSGERRRLSTFCQTLQAVDGIRVRWSKTLPASRSSYSRPLRAAMRVWAQSAPGIFARFCRPLRASDLHDCKLLIVTTRYELNPYHEDELDIIESFVDRGGSLWLMANHSRIPGADVGDFTTQDTRLAKRFGIAIVEACFESPGQFTHLSPDGAQRHEILQQVAGQHPVSAVLVNNCCGIRTDSVVPVLPLARTMIDLGPHRMETKGLAFAVVSAFGRGRILVTADSGFVTEPGVPGSGPGLIDRGDNQAFAANAVRWLLSS